MKGLKKIIASPLVTVGAFVIAAGLLLFSSIGGARAALTYFSDNYQAQVRLYDIGVTLVENGEAVSWRDYNSQTADGTWNENTGVLLANMLPEGEDFKLGKVYPEVLSVTNSGTINEYVRVTVLRYWEDSSGVKDQTLSPDKIHLHFLSGNGWIEDTEAATPERNVFYWTSLLNAGDSTADLTDTISVDAALAKKVTQETTTKTIGNKTYTDIKTTYDYNGYRFVVEAKVDAVQEHNAQAAIWSAWGRNVNVSNNTLTLN